MSASYSDISLGIVCPMANERTSAEAFVTAVLDVCGHYDFRSIRFFAVLDKVSIDGTLDRMRAYAARDPRVAVVWAPENRSVVDAYVRGYREAVAVSDWILEIDAGFSHQPSDIPQFFELMRQGYDCVFGSRFSSGASSTGTSFKRKFISRGGTLLTNVLLATRLSDMTSGFQMFTRAALSGILARGIHSRSPFFQTEMKVYCRNLRIAEVPIKYRNASHNIRGAALRDSFVQLWRLYRLRLQGQL